MTGIEPTPDVLETMLAKADEMLSSARRALEAGVFGDAVSRAYYAVFHALPACLATHGLVFSSHSQAIGAFNREFVRTDVFPAETSRKLQRLFEDRQVADCDWRRHVDETTAAEDVSDAEAITAQCRQTVRAWSERQR